MCLCRGVVLPGDWGFFVPYLVGGTSIAVLAIGSLNPSLLQGGIEAVAMIASPDTKDRVVRHEAAHFLTAYLLGVPITGYSIGVGEAHTDLCEAGLGRSIFKEGGAYRATHTYTLDSCLSHSQSHSLLCTFTDVAVAAAALSHCVIHTYIHTYIYTYIQASRFRISRDSVSLQWLEWQGRRFTTRK